MLFINLLLGALCLVVIGFLILIAFVVVTNTLDSFIDPIKFNKDK